MSDPVLHIRHQTITTKITATEAAKDFADSDSGGQAVFFLHLARAVKKFDGPDGWSRQCESIADKLSDSERREIASMADALLEQVSKRSYRAERIQ